MILDRAVVKCVHEVHLRSLFREKLQELHAKDLAYSVLDVTSLSELPFAQVITLAANPDDTF